MTIPVDMHRFATEIAALEDRQSPKGQMLLYGSSFFAFWGYDRAARQLASDRLPQTVNHGFGGAIVDELLYYYDRLVRPYAPRALVLRPGVNDIFRGYTPEQAVFLTQRLIEWAKMDNPDIKIAIVLIFDIRKGPEETMNLYRQYNALCQKMADGYSNVTCLDLNPFFYEKEEDIGDRSKLRNVFREDGLHLTDEGYEEMAAYLRPKLEEILK